MSVAVLRALAERRGFGLADPERRKLVRHGYLLALEELDDYNHRPKEPTMPEDTDLPPDDGLDIDYPGLCHDCGEKASHLLKTITGETDEYVLAFMCGLLCVHKRALLGNTVDTEVPF